MGAQTGDNGRKIVSCASAKTRSTLSDTLPDHKSRPMYSNNKRSGLSPLGVFLRFYSLLPLFAPHSRYLPFFFPIPSVSSLLPIARSSCVYIHGYSLLDVAVARIAAKPSAAAPIRASRLPQPRRPTFSPPWKPCEPWQGPHNLRAAIGEERGTKCWALCGWQ